MAGIESTQAAFPSLNSTAEIPTAINSTNVSETRAGNLSSEEGVHSTFPTGSTLYAQNASTQSVEISTVSTREMNSSTLSSSGASSTGALSTNDVSTKINNSTDRSGYNNLSTNVSYEVPTNSPNSTSSSTWTSTNHSATYNMSTTLSNTTSEHQLENSTIIGYVTTLRPVVISVISSEPRQLLFNVRLAVFTIMILVIEDC